MLDGWNSKTKRLSSGPCMLYLDYMIEYDWNMIEWYWMKVSFFECLTWNSSKLWGSIEIMGLNCPIEVVSSCALFLVEVCATGLCPCLHVCFPLHSQSHHLYKFGFLWRSIEIPGPARKYQAAPKLWLDRCSKFSLTAVRSPEFCLALHWDPKDAIHCHVIVGSPGSTAAFERDVAR